MIVGTAGHVDHGKTALVRALTGVDTDRLPEEKARGISINLGYAYQAAPGGQVLGFVDVPGHERFIHAMLAGVTGIDFALLVVAADDGPMPQTLEHLQILGLLGVPRGAIALTKIDRVDAARIDGRVRELQHLVEGTTLAGSPVFPLSSVTGAGVAALQAHLLEQAHGPREPAASAGGFRLAVDRSFTLGGLGTVVTGTVHCGVVRVGEPLVVTPSGQSVRVRSIHASDRAAPEAVAGQRCALNLAGVARDAVARGDWVVAPALHAPTFRLDVRLQLLDHSPPLATGTPLHLHLGAAHRVGRIVPLDGELLEPGASAFAQIVLDAPIGALFGDRFIVRDAAAARTLGGGAVVDPWAPARRRRSAGRRALLQALEEPDIATALRRWSALDAPDGDLDAFCRARNVAPDALELPDGVRMIASGTGRWAFATHRWDALLVTVTQGLDQFHRDHPDELGPDPERLRRMFLAATPLPVVAALVDALVQAGTVCRAGPWLHLPGHGLVLAGAEAQLAALVLPRVAAGGYDPPWVRDIARDLARDEEAVRQILRRLTRRGEVFQVVRDLFYGREAVAALAGIANELEAADGAVRAAVFRDRSGIGRKRAVQVLEFFDRVGFTRRVRDGHRVRSDSLLRLASVQNAVTAAAASAAPS